MTAPTPTPPFAAFLAVSALPGGPGALYTVQFDQDPAPQSAVNVQYVVTDSAGINVLQPTSVTIPLKFADASGNTTKKIRKRVEYAVLSRLADAGIGANIDNVSLVWVEG